MSALLGARVAVASTDAEQAETDMFADASSLAPTYGWEVTHNNYDMRNEQYGKEGNHTWENNGLAAAAARVG